LTEFNIPSFRGKSSSNPKKSRKKFSNRLLPVKNGIPDTFAPAGERQTDIRHTLKKSSTDPDVTNSPHESKQDQSNMPE